MSSTNQNNSYRWVLLSHIGAPDDLKGIHFDLLLEGTEFCQAWRLSEIPLIDGPYVEAVHIAPHKLDWLDIKEKVVSGNRGVAKRIKKGFFVQELPKIKYQLINLSLKWENIEVDLVIDQKGCRLLSTKN